VTVPRVILLHGPKFSGKSRFVERLARELREAGTRLSGFFQRGVFDGAGRKIGYDLVDAASGTGRPLVRINEALDRWVFDDAVFDFAAAALDPDADLTIVDEVGPLELSGGGHRLALEAVLGGRAALLLVVREELADEFAALPAPRAAVIRVRYDPSAEAEVAKRIRALILEK
jgi:nucleoside-triphosphatase THEP1